MVEAKSNESTKSRQRFFRIIVRLNDLSIKLDKTEKSPENLECLLREALHFEADLKSWASSLDQSWRYTVINTKASSRNENICFATGRQSQHRYHDAGIAGLWNFYRQMRIIVNDMIRFICQHILNFQWSHECEQIMFQSTAVIDQLVDDICASIDFYFVYGPPGISAVLRLQLPLFVAAVCTEKYSERYMWIMEKLEMLSTLTGFEQTISLAHRLKEGQIYGIIPSK